MIGAVNSRNRPWVGLVLVTALCQGCASQMGQENTGGTPVASVASDQLAKASEQSAEREKAIQAYRQHLARFPDSPDYDAVTRRLADLLLDSASDPAAGGLDVAVDDDRAAASYREAIAAYEYLLDKSPGDTELLYQLSRAYEESGQPRQALAAVDQLLDQSRDESPRLRSDTLFRQGELLFDADKFAGAESAYAAVIALGEEAPAFEQSLYKLGWSLYMQGRYAEALDPFFAYLETLPGPLSPESIAAAEPSPLEREQVTELLDVISNCFAHLGGVQAAERFFA